MKRFIPALFALLLSASAFAQSDYLPPVKSANEKSSFKDRLFTGGNFGLQFGTATVVDISPIIGYRLTERWSAGLGATYIYYNYKDSYYNYSYSTSIYGGSIFTRFNVSELIFLHTEFQSLSAEFMTYYPKTERKLVDALFVGGGYRQMIGDASSINLMILYDLMYTDVYHIYSDPWQIRVGFDFGL